MVIFSVDSYVIMAGKCTDGNGGVPLPFKMTLMSASFYSKP